MYITNYQKILDNDLKTDSNFRLVYKYSLNQNTVLAKANLIGAASKPLSLGFIYHLYFILPNTGEIICV